MPPFQGSGSANCIYWFRGFRPRRTSPPATKWRPLRGSGKSVVPMGLGKRVGAFGDPGLKNPGLLSVAATRLRHDPSINAGARVGRRKQA
jgi:hypothetical protein